MMLTLVLLVGAVSCSPVPSEPSLQASAVHHGTSPAGASPVEVTHAVQVTHEMSAEVGETTASTTSSELSGEDDPPIPTATTPPVLPDSEPHEANPAVTEPHLTQQHQTQPNHPSHGSPLVIQPHESHDTHHRESLSLSQATRPHDLQGNSSHASDSQPKTSSPEVIQSQDTSSGVTHIHNTKQEVIQSYGAGPEATLSLDRSSEEALPHSHKITKGTSEPISGEAVPRTDVPEDGSTEKSSSSREIQSQSSEHKQHLQSVSTHHSIEASASHESNESSQQFSDNDAKFQNSKNGSKVPHTLHHHHHHQDVETVVEADLHSWESSEHRHFSASAVKAATDADTGEDLADEGNQAVRNASAQRGSVREALHAGDASEDGKEKVEYIDTVALSSDTEEDITEDIVAEGQQVSGIQISIAEDGAPQHPREPVESGSRPSEETTMSDIKGQTRETSDSVEKQKEPDDNKESKHNGEMEELPSLVMDSSSHIDIVERSQEAERDVLDAAASETVIETVPQEAKLTPPAVIAEESSRRSRTYPKSNTEQETHDSTHEDDLKVQDQKESENPGGSRLHLSGLESMSMTSPTPDTPQGEGTPTAEDPEATIVPPETFVGNENVTTTGIEGKVEGNAEGSVLAPGVAPPPTEDYTDNYNDPISPGNLPDLVVTQEEIPFKEQPQTDLPLLSTSDKEVGGSLRKEGGVAWALLPQQEQVSAVAPNSLTPGCIVAIVFGVILSTVVVLGIGGFVVWQRRTLNRPKVLGSDRGYAGSDSGGYIDDQVRVSYVNSQIDSPKGSPEDLISLDNDSFLNSLESMTIQNLWTDNIRHTKL